MMMLDWSGYRQELLGRIGDLGRLTPQTVRGYRDLSDAGSKTAHLDAKSRELIALAVEPSTAAQRPCEAGLQPVDTIPSFAPRTAARSQPIRPVRCPSRCRRIDLKPDSFVSPRLIFHAGAFWPRPGSMSNPECPAGPRRIWRCTACVR